MEYCVLEADLPGRAPRNAGVLLYDPWTDTLRVRARREWHEIADQEDAEVLSRIEEDLTERAARMSGGELLKELEDTLSNVLRLSERRSVAVANSDKALDRLYEEHVEERAPRERHVVTLQRPIPVYSLRAAATKFGEDMEAEAPGFVEAPGNLQSTERLYGVRVVGRSMEPLIPDGSLALFRYPVVGSRQGMVLLIWRKGASELGGEFTVKRYSSVKRVSEEGWRHERIRLVPVNPEFDAFELEPSELEDGPYRVLGEFVQVIPYEEVKFARYLPAD